MRAEVPDFDLADWMYDQLKEKLKALGEQPSKEEFQDLADQCLHKFKGFIVQYYIKEQHLEDDFAQSLASAVCYETMGRAKYYKTMARLMEAGLAYAKHMFEKGINFRLETSDAAEQIDSETSSENSSSQRSQPQIDDMEWRAIVRAIVENKFPVGEMETELVEQLIEDTSERLENIVNRMILEEIERLGRINEFDRFLDRANNKEIVAYFVQTISDFEDFCRSVICEAISELDADPRKVIGNADAAVGTIFSKLAGPLMKGIIKGSIENE